MNKKIIVIGGLSAGPSAAAKARREDENAEIILFEKTENISYATCGIPYAFSGKIKNREKLIVVKPELLRDRFNIDVHLNEPVISIDPDKQEVITPKGTYQYHKLVYATGGSAIIPPIKNLDSCDLWTTCKTLEDYDKIIKDKVLEDKESIAIIGAGLIGIETAENLIEAGKTVHIIERGNDVLSIFSPMYSRLLRKVLTSNKVNVHLNTTATELNLKDNELILDDGRVIPADYLIIGIGVIPNTKMLKDKGAKTSPNGALIVDENMKTSLPNVYSAGDCVVLNNLITDNYQYFPMGTHSNKGGRTAGVNISSHKENRTFKGAYGTGIVKVFDYTAGRTGLTPNLTQNFPYKSSLIVAKSHPGFYPDGSDVFVTLYFEEDSLRIVGAEVFGKVGVDKRIDVLATAIYAKLSIEDLPNLDLAYAPPFSPAKDPIIVAAYAGENEILGDFSTILPLELNDMIRSKESFQLVDVRNPDEIEKLGKIENAINIPLDDLRGRINELDKEHPVYIYCAKGMRGYIASRILEHNDFDNVTNISGGFNVWNMLGLPIVK